MSFAAVIISEVTRTSDDDLSQSAYDAALAGIEDAKLAYYNYQRCLETGQDFTNAQLTDGNSVTCSDIMYWMKPVNADCDMVGHILGRIGKRESGVNGVLIREKSSGDNNMEEAYTCVTIDTGLPDYRANLSSTNTTRVVPVRLGDGESVEAVDKVVISWYSGTDGKEYAWTNWTNTNNANGAVTFPSLTKEAATPPTIAVGLVQTGGRFSLGDFDKTETGGSITRTNRGTVYLVPTKNLNAAKGKNTPDNYIGAYNSTSGINLITNSQITKSNDRTVKNLPYAVYCGEPNSDSEFACSATLELPNPIGGDGRNDETFMFVVSIPYGQPSTDFSLEFFCGNTGCGGGVIGSEQGIEANQATVSSQVRIDSTGRANDLYRRVEARIDTTDTYFPYPLYAIELLGENSSEILMKKNFSVNCEYQSWSGFPSTCGS